MMVIIPSAITAAGISLLVEALFFKKFIWKRYHKYFYPWLCTIPYIGGKWVGTLESDHIDEITGETVPVIPTSMEINHEFDKITVKA